MKVVGLLLSLTGLVLLMRYSDGEFAGTAEDEARRRKLRWLCAGAVLAGQALQIWGDYA